MLVPRKTHIFKVYVLTVSRALRSDRSQMKEVLIIKDWKNTYRHIRTQNHSIWEAPTGQVKLKKGELTETEAETRGKLKVTPRRMKTLIKDEQKHKQSFRKKARETHTARNHFKKAKYGKQGN